MTQEKLAEFLSSYKAWLESNPSRKLWYEKALYDQIKREITRLPESNKDKTLFKLVLNLLVEMSNSSLYASPLRTVRGSYRNLVRELDGLIIQELLAEPLLYKEILAEVIESHKERIHNHPYNQLPGVQQRVAEAEVLRAREIKEENLRHMSLRLKKFKAPQSFCSRRLANSLQQLPRVKASPMLALIIISTINNKQLKPIQRYFILSQLQQRLEKVNNPEVTVDEAVNIAHAAKKAAEQMRQVSSVWSMLWRRLGLEKKVCDFSPTKFSYF
jgi:hypothetical protein